MAPRIRVATEHDIERIAAVVNAAFEVERPMRLSGHRTSSQNVGELMAGGNVFFVSEEEGKLLGAVMVRITGTTGYFGMLAVDPSLQKGGIGRALREHAEAYCRERGCREMTLSTGDFRTELLPYYQRAGYSVVKVEAGPAEWGLVPGFKVVHMAKAL